MPALSGTDVDISFIQYDATAAELREIYSPNSDQNGLLGICKAELQMPNIEKHEDSLRRLFPALEPDGLGFKLPVNNGLLCLQPADSTRLKLTVRSNAANFSGGALSLDNVTIEIG